MRKIIIAILLLITLQSEGQIINASPAYRPVVAAAACNLFLDQYSPAMVADLRRTRCSYTGSLIRVRRSGDNTEQDIGYTSDNDLDTTTLKTFVGSGDGYVVKCYDQSGNSRDAIQSTTTRQPIIMQSGVVVRRNNKPSMYSEGTRYLTVTLSSNLSQPNTIFITGSNSGANDRHLIDQIGSTGTDRNLVGVAGGNLVIYAGNLLTFATNTTNFSLYTAIFNGASSKVQRNGSGTVTGNAGSQSLGSFNIGKGMGEADQNAIVGYISSVIIFNSNQNSNLSSIESAINSYYSIY